jgi:hypothetical protein
MKTPEDYLQEVQTAHHANHDRLGYTFPKSTFRLSYGSKYIKVIENSLGSDRVHCFLDYEGNIYKAASWRVPAKGIRGHSDNEKKPLLGYDYYR